MKPGWRRRSLGCLAAAAGLAVLLSWGVRWLLDQQVIAGASRPRADMRSLSRAIAAYRADHGALPRMIPFEAFCGTTAWSQRPDGQGLGTIDPGSGIRVGLTTPVAYATSLWPDPFLLVPDAMGVRHSQPYAYFTDGDAFILFSPGLDWRFDITAQMLSDAPLESPGPALIGAIYDSTNGLRSQGDLVLIVASPEPVR